MKKVIFICLLSLSVCLSKPADESAGAVTGQTKPPQPPAKQEAPAALPAAGVTQTASEVTKAPPAGTQPPAHATDATHPTENASAKTNTTTPKMEQPATKNETKADTTNAVPKTDDAHKQQNATDPKITTTMAPPANVTEVTTPPVVPTGNNKTVTDKPVVPVKPTEAPSKEGDKIPLQARGFDGASFIGGIILTLGLLAIGFISFKYYKNQTERNYHTL